MSTASLSGRLSGHVVCLPRCLLTRAGSRRVVAAHPDITPTMLPVLDFKAVLLGGGAAIDELAGSWPLAVLVGANDATHARWDRARRRHTSKNRD